MTIHLSGSENTYLRLPKNPGFFVFFSNTESL